MLSMQARWVAYPFTGKICFIVHHLNILNALKKLLKTSHKKQNYICIDRKTASNTCQKHIATFQENPSLPVVVLGVMAAGLGVTELA